MAREFSRSRRIAEQIQRELADLLRTEVKDPRVERVTVSEVKVSRDLSHAQVYVTVLGGDAEAVTAAVEALNGAAGFLRRALSRQMRLRRVPQPHFVEDPSFDTGARLSRLIDEAVAEDAAHHPDGEAPSEDEPSN